MKHCALDFRIGLYPHDNSLFIELSAIFQGSYKQKDTKVDGLYYQTDIELKHVVEKRALYFKKERIRMAIINIHKLVQRKGNKEIKAIYGARNYLVSPSYKKFLGAKLYLIFMEPR